MFKILQNKINRNIVDYGVMVCIRKICSHIFKPLFETRTYHIYVIDLQKVVAKERRESSGILFRYINANEDRLIAQIEKMEEWLNGQLAGKLRDGQKCLVALQGGDTVAGFNLIGFTTFKLPLIRLLKPLRPTECFSEQITVHPAFRNRGLGTDLRYEVFTAMKDAGYHRMYGGTQTCNCANKTLSKKVGFRDFASVRFMSICGFKQVSVKRKKG